MISTELMVWIGLVFLCIVLMMAVGMAYYMIRCVRWRSRIAEMREGKAVYLGWNLRRLKETVRDLEYERVDRMELIF